MADPRWTLCHGCMKPVEVNVSERDERNGVGWFYSCPAPCYSHDDDAQQREREAGDGSVDWDRDIPPPDPLAMLAEIVGAVVERAGREAVAAALGFTP